MPGWKLNQLQQESSGWKRLLCFMLEENIILKNRLSEILKEISDHKLLEVAENYQDRLINTDEMIGFLRNETARLDKFLIRESFENSQLKKELANQIISLRKNMQIAETQFSQLKRDFYNYFSEYILA
jgi:hypothetical protein